MTALTLWAAGAALTFAAALARDTDRRALLHGLVTDPLFLGLAAVAFGLIWPVTLAGLIYSATTVKPPPAPQQKGDE